MAVKVAFIGLTLPLIALAYWVAFPETDTLWRNGSFHFWATSGACLLAAATCTVLVISARSIRETRILFLALSFFSLGMIFAVHGLTTPGILYDGFHTTLQRSPWVSTLAAGFFAFLSVVSIPKFMERSRLRIPEATFAICSGLVLVYFFTSLAWPNWAEGFPTQDEWFQHTLTAVTVTFLVFAAWRYIQSYQFARLPGQLAVAVGLLFLAEAQLSLDFGRVYQYSWWEYHGLFLAAFLAVLGGWAWELIRARDASAIAEGIAMRDGLAQLNRGRPADLVALADQIENHDLETFRHVDRVAAVSYAIGQAMGFHANKLRELVLSAQMHDIGKIGLPPYILTKPGALTEDEWVQMKQHPGKGFDIVGRVKGLDTIAKVIRHHHERFDGSGYPDKLAGEAIPIEARIISAADTFDALTSERPYRRMLGIEEAKAELRRVAGTQLDPNCVDTLIRLLEDGTLKHRNGTVPCEAVVHKDNSVHSHAH